MNYPVVKTAFAALVAGGVLAGCATTVDMGGPLGHYRYDYDSRPVVSESTVTVPAPAVTYRESTVTSRAPVVTYREPVVTYRDPVVTYREPVVTYQTPSVTYGNPTVTYRESRVISREPTVTYYAPSVVYELHPSPSLSYTDHGQ